jgi:serine/threonine-protein kinase RsbW
LRYRDLAVRVVAAACKLVGTDGDVSTSGFTRISADFDHEVVSAFGEAFNNIAIHGYDRGRTAGDIEVEIEVRKDGIVLRLIDHGQSYAIEDVPQPNLEALPESGVGLYIIRSFVDEVSYRPGNPNVTILTKRIRP